ncbi:adenosylcobalamin-dependent ribonucleoside-diphosphate reductase, partial [Candidatus Dojkabacteria bacterium]|nr:adenosylcobalamin-dependent ribonucleoside-diphosphate reductase [Candidatus Dojkabacteria bacterium]
TPEELWRRIAKKIASAELKYNKSNQEIQKIEDDFFTVMNRNEFHSGGTLIWAGMDALGMNALMSKCFVLPVEDSIDGIFSTLKKNIEVLTKGGGTGFNFSHIRSTYSRVTTTGEKAAGPVEYLKTYNRAQDTLTGRGGRQMGSMAILNIDHPNIEDFIEAKDDFAELSHYNISVGVSNKFMKALENNDDWDLIDPFDHQVKKTVKAKELWDKISAHAWKSGDPGLFFIDKAEEANTTPRLGRIEATNPCGEQPLLPYESCNLGNINLSAFVMGFPFIEKRKLITAHEAESYINWDRLREVTEIGVRFLDNIIDVNNYPVAEIEDMTKKTRNIGLGVMGVADMLIKLGIPYESEEALKLSEKVMQFIQEAARNYSEELGKEKGSFPAFESSIWKERFDKSHMRNTRTTTIAPTGTVAIIAGSNPGIEPLFALAYTRKNSMGGTVQEVLDPLFEQAAKAFGYLTKDIKKKIVESGKIDSINEIDSSFKSLFKTSHEIDPKQHVRLQAAFQKYV